MRGKTRRPSGDCATPERMMAWVGRAVMSSPSSVTRPDRARGSPQMLISSVDFPAPLAPISVTISPRSTCSETPFNACTAP